MSNYLMMLLNIAVDYRIYKYWELIPVADARSDTFTFWRNPHNKTVVHTATRRSRTVSRRDCIIWRDQYGNERRLLRSLMHPISLTLGISPAIIFKYLSKPILSKNDKSTMAKFEHGSHIQINTLLTTRPRTY